MAKDFEGKKVLITGGLGFVGSNLAHYFGSRGAQVTAFDACIEPYGFNEFNLEGAGKNVRFAKGDIRNEKEISAAVAGQDIIIGCAAQVSHIDSMSDPFLDVDINCRGTLVFLEACRKHADGAKIIYAGTRGQMGGLVYSPADELHPDNPTDVYGVDKLAAEKYHFVYGKAYGMKVCSLRLNNTYGERHQMKHGKYGILNWFVRLALQDREIQIYGDGRQKRDYNYVADACEAFGLAAKSQKSNGQVYLLGSGEAVPFADMAQKVVQIAGGGRVKLVPWPPERKAIEVGDFFVSYEKIRKDLGWEPKVGLDEGLEKTVAFYRKNLKRYI